MQSGQEDKYMTRKTTETPGAYVDLAYQYEEKNKEYMGCL